MSEHGRLISFVGAMGSGKTEQLISLYEELLERGVNVGVFKPETVRSGEEGNFVYSRSGKKAPATTVTCLDEMAAVADDMLLEVILIDEIQFFEEEEADIILDGIAMSGATVYVFGLDVDSENQTFGMIGEIMAKSDDVFKLKTDCVQCGNPARISSYEGEKQGVVKPGDLGEYQPLCRACFYGYSPVEADVERIETIMIVGEDFTFTFDIEVDKLPLIGFSIADLHAQEITMQDALTILTKLRELKE